MLTEIQEMIKKLEQKEEGIYTPRKKLFEEIENGDLYNWDLLIKNFINELMLYHQLDPKLLFNTICGIKAKQAERMERDMKERIIKKIEGKIRKVPIVENALSYYYDRNVKFKSERIRMITKGIDVTLYHFIDDEGIMTINENIRKIFILSLREWLLEEKNRYKIALCAMEIINGTQKRYYERFFKTSRLETFIGNEKEANLVKEIAKDYYKKRNSQPLLLDDDDIQHIQDYIEFVDGETKKELKEKKWRQLKEKFERLKKSQSEDKLHFVKQLKEEVEIVMSWGGKDETDR